MYGADPYVAERSMALYVDEALREAGRPRGLGHVAPVRKLARRASRRLSLLLISAGGNLVRHTLPPYRPSRAG